MEQKEFLSEKGKMRKWVQNARCKNSFLSDGTLKVSRKFSSPLVLDNVVGVSSVFQLCASERGLFQRKEREG